MRKLIVASVVVGVNPVAPTRLNSAIVVVVVVVVALATIVVEKSYRRHSHITNTTC